MTFNIVYSTGATMERFSFTDEDHYYRWAAAIESIKSHIAAINNDGNAGVARVPHYENWLNTVRAFVRDWGVDFLPHDIKAAVNDVEDGIGMERTVWATEEA